MLHQKNIIGSSIEHSSENTETQHCQDEDHSESENSLTAGNYVDLDPKVRQGLERIKKLDNILSEKTKVHRCLFFSQPVKLTFTMLSGLNEK